MRQPTAAPVATRPVLAIDGVAKAVRSGSPWHRRRAEVLRGASLEVRAGELVGLVGENGSGKSTLLKLMAGTTRPTRGSIGGDAPISTLIELGAGFPPA